MEKLIGEHNYQIGRMDAFTQFHVARKLSPALGLIDGLVAKKNEGKDFTVLALLIMNQLGDSDVEYVMNKCLAIVHRQQPTGWAKLTAGAGQIMFDDTTLDELLNISVAVIVENLGDFFVKALAGINQGAIATA